MIVGIKDIFKMLGIIIISACAVFVCTLFLNYNIDLKDIEGLISTSQTQLFYDAQVMTGKVVIVLSGGCLFLTSVVLLLFYIKHYIDTHRKELGILKAMGYSNLKIALSFWVFGMSIFLGTVSGYICAYCIMPLFYSVQNEDKLLPEVIIHFHPVLIICLVLLPSLFFAFLSVIYSYIKLEIPVIELLRGKNIQRVRASKSANDMPFLWELKKSTVRQRKSLVFFIAFATFCYAAMVQMSFSMRELSSVMMSVMIFSIGIILACVTLFLAVTTVVKSNMKTLAMMQVFGYSGDECRKAVLSGYRKIACIGFVIGTIYQYVLLKIAVYVIFSDIDNIPDYNFDIPVFIITLISFVILYELIMYWYSRRIGKISVKEIMLNTEL